jgi:hypothetical protein
LFDLGSSFGGILWRRNIRENFVVWVLGPQVSGIHQ